MDSSQALHTFFAERVRSIFVAILFVARMVVCVVSTRVVDVVESILALVATELATVVELATLQAGLLSHWLPLS